MSEITSVKRRQNNISVLIVDDSSSFRRELRNYLESERGITVVGEAENGLRAVEMTELKKPDVVLMDQSMPELSGVDATRRIKASWPSTRVIFVAAEGQSQQDAIRAGAERYFLKEDDLLDLTEAIKDPLASLRPLVTAAPQRELGRLWGDKWLWRGVSALLGVSYVAALAASPQITLLWTSLVCGILFFIYGLKYYLSVALVLFATSGNGNNHNGINHGRRLNSFFNGKAKERGDGKGNGRGLNGLRLANGGNGRLPRHLQPFISIHLPLYNETAVVDRLLTACTSLDYENYEVIVADDSTDETSQILKERWESHPRVKLSHRIDRNGFKGGALRVAMGRIDPRTEFIVVLDADFVPQPDILHQFLAYFYGTNGANGHHHPIPQGATKLDLVDERVAVVQGYQWHMLNASENWITRGIRSEYSGSYVVERSCQEFLGSMKMISGSVFMIRADVLKKVGWKTSITEDWELTLRLYLEGYKVLYTPFIQAPAECVASFRDLSRQRMRWAEGHTFNVKKYFLRVLQTPNISRREKLEFVYYAPYYLQSAFFLLGTGAWLTTDLLLNVDLPFWTATLGWSLVFANGFSLILMNLAGLFLERGVRRNWAGILSFILLTYLLVPYQAYAALKGLFEPHEGDWHRTLKTGVITEIVERLGLRRRLRRILPKQQRRSYASASRLVGFKDRLIQSLPPPFRRLLGPGGLRFRLASGLAIGILLLSILAARILVVSAAPDSFYLRDTATTGASPAGKDMNGVQGSSEDTLVFDGAEDEATWYTDITYPTGGDDATILGGDYKLEMYFDQLPSDWWDSDYLYRKQITVTTNGTAVDAGYSVSFTFDHDSLTPAKSLASGDDIRVVHRNGSAWTELDRALDPLSNWNDLSTQIWFSLVDPIASPGSDSNYYLYYGNSSASTPPDDWANVFLMGDDFEDGTLTSGVSTSTNGTATISETVEGTDGVAFIDLGSANADAGIIVDSTALPSDKQFAIRHKTKLVSGGGVSNPEVKNIGIQESAGQAAVDNGVLENPRRRIIAFHRCEEAGDPLHDREVLLFYFNTAGTQVNWDGTNWVTTSVFWSIEPLDTYYIYDLVSNGSSWFLRVSDADGTVRTTTTAVNWSDVKRNDPADPLWFYWGEIYSDFYYADQKSDWVYVRDYVDPEPSASLSVTEDNAPFVKVSVSVYHTKGDGSDPLQIVAASDLKIDANTPDPYELTVGNGAEQAFTSVDPRRLRVHIDVTQVNGGGNFTLAYDSSANPSSLVTPALTVYDFTLLLLAVVILIPIVTGLATRKRRLAVRIISVTVSVIVALSILAQQVFLVSAAPDSFFLRDTTANGASPAGKDMNDAQGTSEDTLLFGDPTDEAYWYTDMTYPTGGDDAFISAGSYTLNMHFDQLPQLPADWYSADWDYRKKITIDSGLVTADQTDFPVLISLPPDANLAASALDNADDILFTSDNGTTKLSHEIEYFSGTNGALQAWVKVQNLSSSADTELYIYYGNANALNQENASDVWSNGYQEVWHFDETSGTHQDSTSNPYIGTVQGSVDQDATGQINGADEFLGPATTSWVEAGNGTLAAVSPFSIEAWFKLEAVPSPATWLGIVTKGRDSDPDWVGLWLDDTATLIFGWDWKDVGNLNGSTLSAGNWYHAAAVFNGTSRSLYLNGGLDAGPAAGGSFANITEYTRVGNDGADVNAKSFDGIIDEVRVSTLARTQSWIATEYNNQANQGVGTGKFIKTLGSEEAAPRVQITVSVYSTRANGSDAQEIITSALTDIRANTTDPYPLDIGSGAAKTFTSSDPRRLRVYVDVAEVYGGGSFTLAYDSSANPSSLVTPALTVYDFTLLLIAVVVLIPIVTGLATRKRRLTIRIISMSVSVLVALAILAQQIFLVSAAPDVFYLRDTTNNGASPAGQDLDLIQGSSEDTLLFDDSLDEAYWYTELTYPTGDEDASIAAGMYSLNMHFDQLPQTPSDWYNADWPYRKKLTIDASKVMANFLTFPVLVSLDGDANLAAEAQADGGDILFASSDGLTKLDHEIELFETEAGSEKLVAWVEVQNLSSVSDTDIYMYYGNDSVADQWNVNGTWDTNHKGVWHLAEDPGPGGSGDIFDSTLNNKHGTAEASMTNQDLVPGQIGNGIDFDGGDDNLRMPDPLDGDNITFSAWIKPTNLTDDFYTVAQRDHESGSWYDWQLYAKAADATEPGNAVFRVDTNDDGESSDEAESGIGLLINTWYYIAGTYDGNDIIFYLDGQLTDSQDYPGTIPDSDEDLWIAMNGVYGDPFQGIIDEVRISNTPRTAEWIQTSYNNQYIPSQFYKSIGDEETLPGVDIVVSIYHTNASGGDAQEIITSSTVTIDASTTDPYSLDIGDGAEQNFSTSDPRHLRIHIDVTAVRSGSSFTLAYDSAANPSSLTMPSLVVFDITIFLLAVVILIPIVTGLATRKRRLAVRIISVSISVLVALALLAQQVFLVSAAPDSFYLKDSDTSGIAPAGEYMDGTAPNDPAPPEEFPAGPVYRSIGTNAGTIYSLGKASIESGTTTVTFSNGASLPTPTAVGAVGVGDKLVIGSETFFILSRDDATHVTVQNSAASTHSSEDYTITRAYNTFQAWEAACGATPCQPTSSGGRGGNLVGESRIEIGVAYKDGVFSPTGVIGIYGSTTDSSYYMGVTAAVGQRHNGVAGTGVIIDGGSMGSGHVFHIQDPSFRLEWLEIRNYDGDSAVGNPVNVEEAEAPGTYISHLIIHDYTDNAGRGGINIYDDTTVRNSILYNGPTGIRTYGADNPQVTLENVTIYGMSNDGFRAQAAGTYYLKNTISVGSTNQDFDIDDAGVVIDASSGYNLYATVQGGVHPGSNNQSPPASLEDLFVSIAAGSEDLHLEPGGHNAIDNGLSLAGSFTIDIDNLPRPYRAGWDIGADERLPYTRFDTTDQDAYWYTDITYPTGGESGGIAAGDYSLNMHFDKLPATGTSVSITVTVSRTASGGTPATEIVSTSTTIDSSTTSPLNLSIGTGAAQTFDPGADERLQVQIHVDSISGGGSFALAYDTTAKPSSLATPSITIPDITVLLVAVVIFIPIVMNLFMKKRRLAVRLASFGLSLVAVLAIVGQQVIPVSAAPDSFFLHDTATGGGSITYQDTQTTAQTTAGSYSLPTIAGGTDQLYLVSVAIYGTGVTVSSVDGGGLSWSLQVSQCAARISNPHVEIWQAFGSPSSFAANVTLSGAPDRSSAAISSYSGADSTTPTEGAAGSNTNGLNGACGSGTDDANAWLSLTSSQDNSVLYVATHPRNTLIDTPDPDYTQRAFINNESGGDGANLYIHDRTLATAGTDSADHLLHIVSPWDMAGLVIKPASDITPAGKTMNVTLGSGGSTLAFDTPGQNAYWYTDITYPTGDENATIAAGAYTLNMHFSQLPAAWYDSDWSFRKQLTLDSSMVVADLSYFPVLVSLTDTGLRDYAQADGGDILFTNSSGTKLDHEIEKYVPGTGELVAWVEVQSLLGLTDTDLYMYYGNGTVADQWNVNGVWDSDYIGVWHLDESGDGTFEEFQDSTANNNHGTGGKGCYNCETGINYVPTQGAAKIGDGQTFDGANDFIDMASSGWKDSNWSYRKRIMIDGDLVSGSSTLINFPVLIKIAPNTDNDLKHTSYDGHVGKLDGTDIFFTNDEGQGWQTGEFSLHHEIEKYDPATGELVVWVEIPDISPYEDTTLYMYYGNAGASDQQSVADVWDTNYGAVWHLKETTGGSEAIKDSTSNNNHGTDSGDPTLGVTGNMDGAIYFDGDGDYITVPSPVNVSPPNYFTASAWIKVNSTDSGEIVSRGDSYNIRLYSGGDIQFSIYRSGSWDNKNPSGAEITDFNEFHYIACGVNETGSFYSIDGVNLQQQFDTGPIDYSLGPTVKIGRHGAVTPNPDYDFSGIIDEVRISVVGRSDDWIATEYANQNDPSTFYQVLSEETPNDVTLDLTGTQITLQAWVKYASGASGIDGVMTKNGFADGYRLVMEDAKDLSFAIGKEGNALNSDGTITSDPDWHHLVGTYDGATMRIYIDGAPDTATFPQIVSLESAGKEFWIGHGDHAIDKEWSYPWDGVLDEVRVSDIVRTAEWIQTEFNNQDNQGTGTGKFIKTLGSQESVPSVEIQVSVYHTAADGSDAQEIITSSTFTIDSNTPNPYALNIGSGGAQSFTSSNPRRLRVLIDVTGVSGAGSFTLAYDSAANDSSLDTPSMVVPDLTLFLVAVVIFIPIVMNLFMKKRRLAIRLASFAISLVVVLGILGQNVLPVTAAPDVFYLHNTDIGDATWYDADWAYRMKITIDGAQVSGTSDLAYFPVLVNMTVADWADTGNGGKVVQSDGGDILFTASNGTTKLDHEIERYDNTSGELIAWIEVPSVSYDSDTDIYIYYGNSTGVPDQWNINGTWDEGGSQNYRGVWHLKEASDNAVDSTSYGTSGSVTGTVTRESTGAVGYAYDYGTDGQVAAGDPVDGHLDFGTNSFTVSMWLNVDQSTGNYQLPLSKGGWSASPPGYTFEINQDGNGLQFEISDGSSYLTSPASGIEFDTWYYVAGVVDKANNRIRLYVDGSEIGSGTDISSVTSVNSAEDLEFAFDAYDLDGILDEVRIAYSARTPGWIATESSNQDSPSTFFKPLGSEETPGVSPAGKEMNAALGSGGSTLVFNSTDDEAYWYTELTYPTGEDDASIADGDYTLNMHFDQLPSNWWDTDYLYRHQIEVTTTTAAVDAGYSVSFTFNHANLYANSKSLITGNDVRVVHRNGSTWTELDRALDPLSSWNNTSTQIWFALVDPIAAPSTDSNYYLYYGNSDASSSPDDWANVFMVGDDFDDGALTSGVTTSTAGTASITEVGGEASIDLGTNELTDAGIIVKTTALPIDSQFAIRHKTKLIGGGGVSNPEVKNIGIQESAGQAAVDTSANENSRRRIIDFTRVSTQAQVYYFDGPESVNYWDGAAWQTGNGFWGNLSLDTYYIHELISDGTDWYVRISNANGTEIEVTTPILWSNTYDTGSPFWFYWGEIYTDFYYADQKSDWVYVRDYVDPEPTATLIGTETDAPFVKVIVSVYHTNPTGGDAQEIVTSSTMTIDANTSDPYTLPIGSGSEQTFTSVDPRRLRVHIDVTAVNGGGSFTLAYDSAANDSSLDTPSMVVPDLTLFLAAVVIFIPIVMNLFMKKRRLAVRLASFAISLVVALGILGQNVLPVTAAPDVFYLRDTSTNGATPAGQDMNINQGSSEDTLLFDGTDDDVYWYTELTYPTGEDDAGIAAGAYSLNMHFSSLPDGTGWWDTAYQFRQQITVTAGSAAVPTAYSVRVQFDHQSLVDANNSLITGNDVRIVYWNGSAWVELDRALDTGSAWNNASTKVWFSTQAEIGASASDGNYYLYYGNAAAGSPPANRANIYLFFDDFEAGNLSRWTVESGLWQIATDFAHTGTYSLRYPPQADGRTYILANPALDEANVYFDAWWRFSSTTSLDFSQIFRRNSVANSHYETDLVGASGWDIAKIISGTWSELSPEASTPTLNTWTRIGTAIADTGMRVFKDGTQINPASGSYNVGSELSSGNIGFKKYNPGSYWWADDVVVRRYVDPEPTTGLGGEVDAPFVQVIVSVYHTDPSGGDLQEIVTSSTITIDANTPNPYALPIGNGSEKTFNSADPRRLRVHIDITAINGGGSFTLAYDSAANDSSLDTPSMVVPELTILLIAAVVLIPIVTALLTKKRRLAVRLIGIFTSLIIALSLLSQQVIPTSAAPDVFYLHDTTVGSSDWYDTDWSYRKKITIYASEVIADESYFPVLIDQSSDAELAASAQADGGDILFTSDNGTTKLDHEIEKYVSGTGQLVAWVEVPSLSSSINTELYMYYGNATVADQWNINGTWDEGGSNYFEGVWHLAEDPGPGGAGDIIDSTSNNHHGTAEASMLAEDLVPGQIGDGIDFDGGDDYLWMPDPLDGSSMTFSAWIWPTDLTNGWHTVAQRDDAGEYWYDWQFYARANDAPTTNHAVFRVDVDDNEDINEQAGSDIELSINTWYYVAGTYNGTDLIFYRDGQLRDTDNEPGSIPDSNKDLWIAMNEIWTEPFQGIIDEVRVSDTPRDAEWIETSYNNQYDPSTFYDLDIQETPGITPAGKFMNILTGTGGATRIFDSTDDEAYWYTELTYPTGDDNASIAAGNYTFNMYFNQLPAAIQAPAVNSTTNGTASTGATSITIAHNVSGENRLMLVGVSINNDDNETVVYPDGITWKGTETLTRVGWVINTQSGNDDSRVEIWSLVAPSTGSGDVVINFSAALAREAVAGVMTFTGVDQNTPLGTFASNEFDDSPATVLVSSATNELVFGVVCSEYGTITTDPGQTERWNRAVNNNTYGAGSTKAGASSVTLQWTLDIDPTPHWAAAGVSIKPVVPSVNVIVSVYHTLGDGSDEQEIVTSSTITIDSNTPLDNYQLPIGSGSEQIFDDPLNPRRLRLHIDVTAVSGGGSFILVYDSEADPSSLDTPSMVVPEWGLAFLLLVPLVPYLMSAIWRRKRLAGKITSVLLGVSVALGLLAQQVAPVGAAPDTFYLHTTDTSGITPAGEYMNTTMGTSGGFDVGDGRDGSVTISSGSQNINSDVIGSLRSTYADGILTTVTANPTGTSISVTSSNGFVAGDDLILINLQGALGDTDDVGNYEVLEVDSVPNSTTINVKTTIANSYDGNNFNDQSVVVQRIPQWTTVSITGTLTANDWDGSSGGIITFKASGSVMINSGGAINANALGYEGGAGGNADGGTNGESYDGTVGKGGAGGGAGSYGGGAGTYNGSTSTGIRGGGGGGGYDSQSGSTEGGGGGGGGGYGGGGGGGGASGDGSSNSGDGGGGGDTGIAGGGGGSAEGDWAGGDGGDAGNPGGDSGGGGVPGGAVGSGTTTGGGGRSDATDPDSGGAGGGGGGFRGDTGLVDLFLGSGGGGGGGSNEGPSVGRTGGDGGGIILIIADTVTVSGSITSDGEDSTAPGDTNSPYGGSGGGAGGSIKIQANSATLGTGLVTASGGDPTNIVGSQAGGGGGGGGGVGRIRVEADSISGSTNPVADTGGTPGGGSETLTFDTAGQDAYWYVDETWPTGDDNATIAAGPYTLNMYFNERPRSWWNSSYQYRQLITITAGTAMPTSYSVRVQFNHQSLVTGGKSLNSGNDIRIVYWNGSSWTELDRRLDDQSSWNSTTTLVWFRTQAAIGAGASDTNYYMYYGYSSAGTPPTTWSNVFLFYDDFNDGTFDTTTRWTCSGTCTESGGNVTVGSSSYMRAKAAYTLGTGTMWEGRVRLGGDGQESDFNFWTASDALDYSNDAIAFYTGSTYSSYVTQNGGAYTEVPYTASTPTSFHLYAFARIGTTSVPFYRDGTLLGTSTSNIPNASLWVYCWNTDSYTMVYDFVRVRNYVSTEPTTSFGSEATSADVRIVVTVSHTAPDGSGPTTIVTSSTTTINSSTANPYALSIGSGAQQTFTSGNPRRLRVQINVSAINGGESFTLAYDTSSDPSSLDTPVIVVPENAIVFIAVAMLIPFVVGGSRYRINFRSFRKRLSSTKKLKDRSIESRGVKDVKGKEY